MKQDYDVLVVGGCTAGMYFAGLMARQGYRTLVMEKDGEEEIGRRYDIFHLAANTFDRFGIAKPQPGDADFVRTFTRNVSLSALNRYPKTTRNEIVVLHRHEFMLRMKTWAQEQGAGVQTGARFDTLTYDAQGKISGAVYTHLGEQITVSARLVADASGIPAVARTSLPEGYGIENFKLGPKDMFYVVLYYVGLTEPEKDRITEGVGWPYYKAWKAPQHDPDGAILGVGANLSYEYAEACFQRFAERIPLPPYTLQHTEYGCTPYRRPPYSFVADGFVALGDAACLANPFSGEGVTAAWLQAGIAAQEAGLVMKNGSYPTKAALWAVNKRYYYAQGAEFAQLLSMLSGALACSPEENDYEFSQSIIFKGDDETTHGSLPGKLFKGLLTGKMRISTLVNLLGAAGAGGKMLRHYRAYPDSEAGYDAWAKKSDALWGSARGMADEAEKDFIAVKAKKETKGRQL